MGYFLCTKLEGLWLPVRVYNLQGPVAAEGIFGWGGGGASLLRILTPSSACGDVGSRARPSRAAASQLTEPRGGRSVT